MNPNLKHLAAAAVLAFLAQAANADEYLVAPLIGDQITVSHAGTTTGTNTGRNPSDVAKLPTLPFDDAIQETLQKAISSADPKATFKALAFRNGLPGVDVLEQADSDEVAKKLVDVLGPQLDPAKKQWVVALFPRRLDHMFQLRTSHTGRNKGSGLGFYVDRSKRLKITSTQESARGFLGVYAYFEIAIIDPKSRTIVARHVVQGSQLVPMAGNDATHPWDLISAEQKADAIRSITVVEIRRAMPELMANASIGK